jgi:SAM-dependent methyltransferase
MVGKRALPEDGLLMRTSVCPLCGTAGRGRRIGTRGNREHFGADPQATPHLWTNVVRCCDCAFLYTSPPLPVGVKLEQAYYNDAGRYTAFEASVGQRSIRRRLAWLARHAKGQLLDVGAGKGEFVLEAGRTGWEAVGLEPSPAFCDYARERLGVTLVCGWLGEEAGISTASFDLVTLNHVLEHVEEPVPLLRSIAAYLRPGGLLFVEVPNCDSLFLRLTDLYFRLRGLPWSSRLSPLHPPFHRFGYTRRSLAFALGRAGFAIVARRTFPGADRGYRVLTHGDALAGRLRTVASRALSLLPNRELLCVLARPVAGSL